MTKVKMMAIVKKEYDIDLTDREQLKRIQAEFDDSCIGSLAIHYFPLEDNDEI